MNPANPNQSPATPENPSPDPTPYAPAPLMDTPVTPLETSETTPIPASNPFSASPVDSAPVVPPMTPDIALATSSIAPVATQSSGSPIAQLLNGPKKKLMIVIAIVVGVLAVVGIVVVAVMNLLSVSKADYRAAAAQFNVVSMAYSDLNSDASRLQYDISGSTTDTVFANDSEAVTTKLQTFKDANTKLATIKSVKSGDSKKLYDTYDIKVKAFTMYAQDLLTSLKSYRPASKACSDAKTVALLSSCVTALGAVGDIPNVDLKQFVTTLQTQYKYYLDIKTKLAVITDPYGTDYEQYKAIRDQGYSIQDKITAAASDFSSNAKKHSDEIDPAPAANALGDYLVKNEN
jgi:hypothetical protein